MGMKLNLSGAKETTFEPIPSGWYNATIYQVEAIETDNPDGNLPVGTPGINVQFKVDYEGQDRRVFTRYYIAPDDYDKKDVMDSMMFTFLKSAGIPEDDLRKKSFDLDPEDLQGREIRVKVGVRPANKEKGYDASNEVKAVKPVSEGDDDNLTAGLL